MAKLNKMEISAIADKIYSDIHVLAKEALLNSLSSIDKIIVLNDRVLYKFINRE